MENRSHAFAAGLFVCLLGFAVLVAFWYFSGKRESTATYLLATKRNVAGLNIQAQVRYRGIRAGKVESIDLDPRDPRIVLVTINLDSRYRLTRATKARLATQGVTGIAFVQLEDDGSSREYLDASAAERPRIELLPSLLDTMGERTGEILDQAAELTRRLNRLADGKNAQNLARTLENAAQVSEGLKQVPQLVAALRTALSEPNLKRLRNILDHIEKAAGEAAPLAGEMRTLVKSMTALAERLDKVAATTGGQLATSTLPQLQSLAKDLDANSRQLSRLLETLDESPQALVFGKAAPRPGPGEAGFVAPVVTEK